MDKTEQLMNAATSGGHQGRMAVTSEYVATGGNQSSIITTTITNGNGVAVQWVLGTPAGIDREQGLYPNIVGQIGDIATNTVFAALVTDAQGLGATFLSALANRFVRNQVFVEAIEIVATDAAQRGNRPTLLNVPYNSATDSNLLAGKFLPVDTEYTGNDLLGKRGAIIGEFTGVVYQINAGATVDINIKLGAVNSPSFVKCGY